MRITTVNVRRFLHPAEVLHCYALLRKEIRIFCVWYVWVLRTLMDVTEEIRMIRVRYASYGLYTDNTDSYIRYAFLRIFLYACGRSESWQPATGENAQKVLLSRITNIFFTDASAASVCVYVTRASLSTQFWALFTDIFTDASAASVCVYVTRA